MQSTSCYPFQGCRVFSAVHLLKAHIRALIFQRSFQKSPFEDDLRALQLLCNFLSFSDRRNACNSPTHNLHAWEVDQSIAMHWRTAGAIALLLRLRSVYQAKTI